MICDDTIAAISTAPGTGAIAIVRISGPLAFDIASHCFRSKKGWSTDPEVPLALTSHVARPGFIFDPLQQKMLDEVVLIPYRGPKSFTGEDLIEINCHGGQLITQQILSLALRLGARPARAGEFTQRAFLSGRIDLTQAEAVMDLIQAKTGAQGQLAMSALTGDLGGGIRRVRQALMDVLSRITAGLDFPEEVGDCPPELVSSSVLESVSTLEELSQTASSGRFLREGLRIAIVGRPNAGKSSLLNRLLKFERAIVTSVPGTTRDSLEELLDLNGIPVLLTDTAGVRTTDDPVEKIGIKRTEQTVGQADLVLLMMDLEKGWGEPEQEISRMIQSKAHILVGNKLDLCPEAKVDHDNGSYGLPVATVLLSATQGVGLKDLTHAIERFVFRDQRRRESGVALNVRQANLCLRAVTALHSVMETLDSGLPQDCLATDLKVAIDALSEICGEAVSEEVIQQVFQNFCIGK